MTRIAYRTLSVLGAIVLVGSLIVGIVAVDVATAPAASAHTSGGNATGGGQPHPWPSDGCTKSPNWIPGTFNFTHACQHHDGCYVNRWAGKETCDQWFLNDMNASCGRLGDTLLFNRPACHAWAQAYYTAVRLCGWHSYNNRTIWTPLSELSTFRACRP